MNKKNENRLNNDEIPEAISAAGKRNPFIVPDGYFDSLTERVLSVTDQIPPVQEKGRIIRLFGSRWRAVAASVAFLLFAGLTYALITEVIIPAFTTEIITPDESLTDTGKQPVKSDEQIAEPFEEIADDQDQPQKHDLFPSLLSPSYSGTKPTTGGAPENGTTPAGQTQFPAGSDLFTSPSYNNQGFSLPPATLQAGSRISFADTVVCRGAILIYNTNLNTSQHKLSWTLNGTSLSSENRANVSINTSTLRYGTHQLSLIVSEPGSGRVVSVANASITVAQVPSVSADRKVCAYDKTLLKTGPRNPHWEYLWSTGENSSEITVYQSGKYWVTVRIKGGNCNVTDTFDVTIMPKPSLNLGSDRTVCGNDKIRFTVKNPTGDYEIRWNPGNVSGNEYIFSEEMPGTYLIKVELTGCSTLSDEVRIRVTDCKLQIPNVFTPNGDGHNDLFIIRGLERYDASRLIVTDRSGQIVYENNDYRNDWDGGGHPNGTYFFILYPGGSSENVRKGSVMILR